jgi:Siphovirus Gp157
MKTLIEISRDLTELDEQLEQLAESPLEQDRAIDNWLAQLEGTIAERNEKLDNYAGLIAEISHRAEIRKAEAKRLSDRADIDENKAKALRSHLQKFFEAHNLKKVDSKRYTLTLVKNGGKLPVLYDSQNIEDYPEAYRKTVTTTSPDREAIRKALESGQSLDFARLGDRGQSMRIK